MIPPNNPQSGLCDSRQPVCLRPTRRCDSHPFWGFLYLLFRLLENAPRREASVIISRHAVAWRGGPMQLCRLRPCFRSLYGQIEPYQ